MQIYLFLFYTDEKDIGFVLLDDLVLKRFQQVKGVGKFEIPTN
jgi:hypothetical protein